MFTLTNSIGKKSPVYIKNVDIFALRLNLIVRSKMHIGHTIHITKFQRIISVAP